MIVINNHYHIIKMKITHNNYQATSNKKVSVPDSSKNIVLYFYPKDSTPGCTQEGLDFSSLHDEFNNNNAIIYGVSRDNMKRHESFKAKQNFKFELISDEDETLCKLFDVIKLKKLYGKEYMGIVRSTFVIKSNGNVSKSWSNVKVDGHAKEVLEFVKTL